jgi:hypothetical protein
MTHARLATSSLLALSLAFAGCLSSSGDEGSEGTHLPPGGDPPGGDGGAIDDEGPDEKFPDEDPDGKEPEKDPDPVEPDPENPPDPPELDPCDESLIVDFAAAAEASDDGTWTLIGASGPERVMEGSCGGEGAETVVRFAAPAAGMWRIETQHERTDYDTLIHVRSECGDADSEIACNDDIVTGRVQPSRVHVSLDEGEAVFVIVDAWERDGMGRFGLVARQMDVVEEGAGCDPAGNDNRCDEGWFCFVEEIGDGEGTCVEATAPVLTVAGLAIDGERLILRAVGTDASRDVVALRIQLLRDGEPIRLGRGGRTEIDLEPRPSVWGEAEVEAFRELETGGPLRSVDGARITLLDSQGLTSETIEVNLAELPAVEPGQPCDATGRTSTCERGSRCLVASPIDGQPAPEEGVCGTPTAPVITSVVAVLNPTTNALGLTITGRDPDLDVTGTRVRLLDADGEIISFSEDGGPPGIDDGVTLEPALRVVEAGDGVFTATASQTLPRAVDGIAAVGVRVVDRTDLISDIAEAEVGVTPTVGEGEVCDVLTALNACPEGGICHQAPPIDGLEEPGAPACVEPVAECPEDWGAGNLNEHGEGEAWIVEGDTSDAAIFAEGSCGGGAGQDVYAFTAPSAGLYSFETDLEDRRDDTVLYARSHCRFTGPSSELACNDDFDTERQQVFSHFELALDEGQTIYVFVDGWGGQDGWTGAYALRVEQE